MKSGFFNTAPLELVLVLIFAAMCLAAWLGMMFSTRHGIDPDDNANEGYLLSATLALLGLLIGFTFSMTLSRYDTRRETIVIEANAIGTAWLRASLVDGAAGEALRATLRGYGQDRLRLPEAVDPAAAEARTGAVQSRLWAETRAAVPAMPPPIAATLITSMNEMFDAATRRRAEREAQIPALVLDLLVLSVVAAAGMVGYVLGGRAARRHGIATLILFALLVLAITMIIDLDRPGTGLIRVPMAPMEETVAQMG